MARPDYQFDERKWAEWRLSLDDDCLTLKKFARIGVDNAAEKKRAQEILGIKDEQSIQD